MHVNDLKIGTIYVVAGQGELRLAELGETVQTMKQHGNYTYWTSADQIVREATPADVRARRREAEARGVGCTDMDCWCWAFAKEWAEENWALGSTSTALRSLSEETAMGKSIEIRYVVHVNSATGFQTPSEWRVRRRGVLPGYGAPTESNLRAFLRAFNASVEPGGANAHLGLGAKVTGGRIVDQQTKTVVAEVSLS